MTDQKKRFLTKLSKILLIVLALLAISVFSLSYIWKYTKTEEDETEPIPSSKQEPAKPTTTKVLLRKSNKATKLRKREDKKEETKRTDTDPKSTISLQNENSIQYEIEPEATSSHLTLKLGDISSGSPISTERIGIIKAYLQHGINPNQVVDNNSPMFLAARSWNLPLLQELGTIDFAAATQDGWTIMHIICENDPSTEQEKKLVSKTLEYLLANGGDIDAINAKNGFSPLMYAIEKGNSEMGEILLKKGAKANGPVNKGFDINPLMLAMRKKHDLMATLLLSQGADFLAYSRDGTSAAQEAVINGYIYGLNLYIDSMELKGMEKPQDIQVPEPAAGEEISEEWSVGATLLHFAVMYNQYEVARYLISYYKVDLTLRDKKNCLALDHARHAVNVYTDDAKRDPAQFGEAKRTAENILKLFEYTEEDHKRYKEERDNQQHNRIVAHTNREYIEYQRRLKDEVIEERRRLGLL